MRICIYIPVTLVIQSQMQTTNGVYVCVILNKPEFEIKVKKFKYPENIFYRTCLIGFIY